MKEFHPALEHGIVYRAKNTLYDYNGWPSVCRDKRGTVFATASSFRLQHVDPNGKNCMFVSFDEGKTWTPPIVVNDSYIDDRDTGIFAWGDGNMIMSWFSERPEDNCQSLLDFDWFPESSKWVAKGTGTAWEHLPAEKIEEGSYVKLSKDYGVTWSDPVKVPVTSPHGPVACADGRLVYMGKVMNPHYLAPNPIEVHTSYDGGYTWEYTGTVPAGDDITAENMHEPHMIELPNGRLLGAIRIHARESQPDFTVYTTYSDDKGKTWSTPVCIDVDGAPPHLMVHSSGAVLCSYSRRRENDNNQYVAVSLDNGETWVENYALTRKAMSYDHGYPCTIELSDGSLLTVYYMSCEDEWNCSVLCTHWRMNNR